MLSVGSWDTNSKPILVILVRSKTNVVPILNSMEMMSMKYQYWFNIGFNLEIFPMKCYFYKNIFIALELFAMKCQYLTNISIFHFIPWQWNCVIFLPNVGKILSNRKYFNVSTIFHANIAFTDQYISNIGQDIANVNVIGLILFTTFAKILSFRWNYLQKNVNIPETVALQLHIGNEIAKYFLWITVHY